MTGGGRKCGDTSLQVQCESTQVSCQVTQPKAYEFYCRKGTEKAVLGGDEGNVLV